MKSTQHGFILLSTLICLTILSFIACTVADAVLLQQRLLSTQQLQETASDRALTILTQVQQQLHQTLLQNQSATTVAIDSATLLSQSTAWWQQYGQSFQQSGTTIGYAVILQQQSVNTSLQANQGTQYHQHPQQPYLVSALGIAADGSQSIQQLSIKAF